MDDEPFHISLRHSQHLNLALKNRCLIIGRKAGLQNVADSGERTQTSPGLYRSCAALTSFSGTFDLILFEAVNFGLVWFGLVWILGLDKQTK